MLLKPFAFRLKASNKYARAGVIITAHGRIETPVFMPVGTYGVVKALTPDDLTLCGAQIILANTYHLFLRPGEKLIKAMGGLHQFMNWSGPILTDSGGYQVTSLESTRKIDEDGVSFYSHLDGKSKRLTPEKAIEIQHDLGVDIMMAFDEATPAKSKRYAKESMGRTHRWLGRCILKWRELKTRQALFGIIQGGNYQDLRRQSAKYVVAQDLPGVAVGGGSIGRDPDETAENISWIRDLLPKDKPLYLMGVGVRQVDLVEAVKAGADMFDCVAPTRLARAGLLYYQDSRINISNAKFRRDKLPIQEGCDCYTCEQGFSRAYLRHLFKANELTYFRLATMHNVRFMIRLVRELRQQIIKKSS